MGPRRQRRGLSRLRKHHAHRLQPVWGEAMRIKSRHEGYLALGVTAEMTERSVLFTDSAFLKIAATSGSRTIAIVPVSIFFAKRFGLDFE